MLGFNLLFHCVDETGDTDTESGNHPFYLLQFDPGFIDVIQGMFAQCRLQSELPRSWFSVDPA